MCPLSAAAARLVKFGAITRLWAEQLRSGGFHICKQSQTPPSGAEALLLVYHGCKQAESEPLIHVSSSSHETQVNQAKVLPRGDNAE